MRERRLKVCLAFIMVGIAVLFARLAQIQLISTESFSKYEINLLEGSVNQRTQEMVIDNGRGNFLDRFGEPLIYENIPVLILFPFLNHLDWPVEEVASVIGIPKHEILNTLENADGPVALGTPDPYLLSKDEMDAINEMKIPGVFAVERKYPLSNTQAEQLIGITGENSSLLKERYEDKEFTSRTLVGLSGLEKSFDEFLVGEGKSKLVYHVDGIGSPLFGINVKYSEPANPFYPINIRTTIDKKLQEVAENLVDKHQIEDGGLVLLDIETNNILAMVSRPHLNRKNPFGDRGVENRMLKQQIPGSVFKTVTAAAAIDYGLQPPSRSFDCDENIYGKPDPNYQHGELNFTQSFARSCNRTFADLAKELKNKDPHIIEEYARKLSLTGSVGWTGTVFHTEQFRQLADEEMGRVFKSENASKDDNFVALSAIGQHEVRVTPLAVANMMATIARGGDKQMVKAVESVEYRNGTKVFGFDEKKLGGDNISPFTAQKLQKLLREVVLDEDGTGRWFRDLPYSVAGKSGTAETGIMKDGKQTHNKWFAGYFPYENPKYALVVVNLGVHTNEGGINPLFAGMVEEVYRFDEEN
ncbi:Cell division protein FtsI/penicillin-binding protein 2 [Mesobacillus persicus]|uniref:serine-type D-Ala-D-Ala carboxypeptidase n=1 Tax=Mesobacillus persicus TaxID=930146 RepID=A0A1H7XD68_9BACI|nr:penicillin-binding protein 2 [Mesobacillus persicus]SEM31127.1 Cell division protein FtsI/penicillin-binding protein 2 [Mesobacillus persicus]